MRKTRVFIALEAQWVFKGKLMNVKNKKKSKIYCVT